MGDRANVVFSTKGLVTGHGLKEALDGNIVLYSHWGGYELGYDLASALGNARSRWDDHGYATRIIVSRIVGGSWTETTGYGLYVGELGDNERNLLVVDFIPQRIVCMSEKGNLIREASFTDFAGFGVDEARSFHLS